MWDDSDRDDSGLDESSAETPRRKKEEPVDLPLGPRESGVAPVRPAAEPPPRRKKAPPLFPDWDPTGSGQSAPSSPGLRPEIPAPSFGGGEAPGADEVGSVPLVARALAGLTDLTMSLLVGGILLAAVRLVGRVPLSGSQAAWTLAFAAELSLVAGILSLFLFGRTPGMAIVSIRAEELDGYPPRFQRAAARVLWSLTGIVLPGVGLVMAAFREDRRSLTDLASGTALRDSRSTDEHPSGDEG